jgi:AcrR family transcriptional regulator
MSAPTQGLRERKNEQTRRAITSAALELASEVGFEHATVAQIAERANVSPRTVHAWFPSKEDIVVGATDVRIDHLAEALRAGGEGDTIDRILRWLESLSASRTEPDELMRLRYRVLLADPQLRALQRSRHEAAEKLIASSIGEETGLSADALGPRALAAAIIAMLLAMEERFIQTRDEDDLDVDIALKMLHAALDALRGGPLRSVRSGGGPARR